MEPTTERAARLLALPAGALHSQRDNGWTKHSTLGQFLGIWMVRRDLLVARSRDMVSFVPNILLGRAAPTSVQSRIIWVAKLGPPFNFEGYSIEPVAGICFLVPQGSAHMPDKESRGHSGVSGRPRWPPGFRTDLDLGITRIQTTRRPARWSPWGSVPLPRLKILTT